MNTEIKEDQATELRNLLDDMLEEVKVKQDETQKSNIDILNLPPRKEVHINKGRAHIKMNKPLIRFLFVILFLTMMMIGAYYFLGEEVIF